MSVFMPPDVIVTNVTISHNTPNFYSESMNMQGRSTDRGIHRMEGSFEVVTQGDSQKKAFEAFLLKVRGRFRPFFLQLGGRFNSTTVNSGVTSTAGQSAGDINFSIQPFMGSISAGDLFNIPNDDKTYMALDNVSSDGGTFEVYPPCRRTFIAGTSLSFNNVTSLVRLSDDIQTISYTESGLIHRSTLNWKEAI